MNAIHQLRSLRRTLRAVLARYSIRNFLIVFNWHQISPSFDPVRHHEYTWTRLDSFKLQIDALVGRFEILPLHEAMDRLNRGTLAGACAALTFDDGDISMAQHVEPALRERGLPATFFINTAYLGKRRSYWFPILNYFVNVDDETQRSLMPEELKQKAHRLRTTKDPAFYRATRSKVEDLAPLVPDLQSRLVSPEWLAALDGEQFVVAAHGHEHQRYAMMPDVWQADDLRENVRCLSQFPAYRPIFALPFGRPLDCAPETLRIARDQGLLVVLADGGINVGPGEACRRVPSDGRSIRPLINATMSEAMGNWSLIPIRR